MRPFHIYILKCSDGSYYTGHTDDIEKRFAEHQENRVPCYTSKRLPVKLVYLQESSTYTEAIISERKIKNWPRKKKEALINMDEEKMFLYSKKKFNKFYFFAIPRYILPMPMASAGTRDERWWESVSFLLCLFK